MGKSEAYDDWPRDRELPDGARQAEADSELAFEQLTEDSNRILRIV